MIPKITYGQESRLNVDFVQNPVIVGENLIIITGHLDPYQPGEHLLVEIYTPLGELAKSDRINEESPTRPGYVDNTGLYRYRYDPMLFVDNTEIIEGVWVVKVSYEGVEGEGRVVVQYQREESIAPAPAEYCNDNPASAIPVDSVECAYHNAEPVDSLKILGPAADECKDFIQASIDKIRAAEKEKNVKTSYFAHLDKYIDRIYCNDEKSVEDGYGVMYFSPSKDPRAFYVNPIGYNPATYENAGQPAKEFLSSVFVHESVHAQQYEESREPDECEAHMLQKDMLATLYGYTKNMNELDEMCNGNNKCVYNGTGHDCKDKDDSGATLVEPEDIIIVETLETVTLQQEGLGNNVTIKGIEKGAKVGQAVNFTVDNTSTNYTLSQGFLQIVEVRDMQGLTQLLQFQTIDANRTNISWVPETAGNYQVRTFMIDDMDDPQLLTPVKTSTFTVFE